MHIGSVHSTNANANAKEPEALIYCSDLGIAYEIVRGGGGQVLQVPEYMYQVVLGQCIS